MAYTINWPFIGFRLRLTNGQPLIAPLTDLNLLSLHGRLEELAQRYQEEFQQAILNEGHYGKLLPENIAGAYYKGPITVAFPASPDGLSFPDFELDFDYYLSLQDNGGAWAIVPVLGIQTYAAVSEEIELHILEAVQLEFSRKRRLSYVQRIIAAIWFETVEMLSADLQYAIPTLQEIHEVVADGYQEKWLPKVAKPLQFSKTQAYGRKEEMKSLEKAIKGKYTGNILLVGAAGCGKTTLVWELAHRLGKRKNSLTIWETTAAHLIKELTAEVGWEENLTQLCEELAGRPDYLFVRNLFELFEVGHYEGNEVSLAEYMKSYLSRGEVHLIAECSEEELARIELRSPNFVSLFQVIRIGEPKTELEQMITQKIKDLAGEVAFKIDPAAVREAIRLTRRYMPYAGFPGRPVAFLERMLLSSLSQKTETVHQIDTDMVVDRFCEESGIPRFMIDTAASFDLKEVRQSFNQQVFGQQLAVDRITDLIATVKTGLTRTGKPIASFLFVGPTGVGKTEMCKTLAKFMFSDTNRMTRFDMSEFSDPYAVIRLLGEGFHSDGLLSAAVRRQPFSLILFDEIEKAHSSFYDLLLQLLSEGRLSDGRGRLVNFCSTIIIMTSNIGADRLQWQKLGWNKKAELSEIYDYFLREVQQFFRPEIYNRIDEVIPFAPLSQTTVRHVVNREIDLFRKREGVQFRAMDLYIDDAVFESLATSGYESKYGARQLQRTIRERLVIPLARRLNEENYDDQLVVNVRDTSEGDLQIDVEADQLGLDLWLEKMNKINFADHCSELRRKVRFLEESYIYLGMLSKIDIFERDLKRKGEAFWQDNPSAAGYTNYMALRQRLNDLRTEIEREENEMALACLDMALYGPAIRERLEDWKNRFFTFKKDLLSQLKPELNYCDIVIFGAKVEPIATYFIDLLERKEWDYNPQSLLLKKNKHWEWEQVLPDSRPYHQLLEEGAKCYGVHLKVEGALAYTYLTSEEGRQDWVLAGDDQRQYTVDIYSVVKEVEIPKGVRRKDFYKNSPRRVVEPLHLRDTKYKLNKAITKGGLVEVIEEYLEQRFTSAVEGLLT